MKRLLLTLLLITLAAVRLPAQSATPAPLPSTNAEQNQIYGAFLDGYSNGNNSLLNVANKTVAFNSMVHGECMQGISADDILAANKSLHSLPATLADRRRILLVDAAGHKAADPEDALRNGKSVDEAVKAGFDAGLLTLSEIVFSRDHALAAMTYGFFCGRLCGQGGTMIFEKQNGAWVLSKRRCGSWIS